MNKRVKKIFSIGVIVFVVGAISVSCGNSKDGESTQISKVEEDNVSSKLKNLFKGYISKDTTYGQKKEEKLIQFGDEIDSIVNKLSPKFKEDIKKDSEPVNETLISKSLGASLDKDNLTDEEKEISIIQVIGDVHFSDNGETPEIATNIYIDFLLDEDGNFKTNEKGLEVLKSLDDRITEEIVKEKIKKSKDTRNIVSLVNDGTEDLGAYKKDVQVFVNKGYVTVTKTKREKLN